MVVYLDSIGNVGDGYIGFGSMGNFGSNLGNGFYLKLNGRFLVRSNQILFYAYVGANQYIALFYYLGGDGYLQF